MVRASYSLLVAGMWGLATATARGDDGKKEPLPTPSEVADHIGKGHTQLLELPNGFSIRYQLDVKQDPVHGSFAWPKGLTGSLVVRWPVLKGVNEGELAVTAFEQGKEVMKTVPTRREGNYNFLTHSGVARDGGTGQIVNARHSFSASTVYPLRLLYFAEIARDYRHNRRYESDVLLPGALYQPGYAVVGTEDAPGGRCLVLKRGSLDTLWVAPQHNYLVLKRERFDPSGALIERAVNSELKELVPGVWIPHRQQFEEFTYRTKVGATATRTEPVKTLTLRVLEAKTGATEQDVQVPLGKDVPYVEDFKANKVYSAPTGDDARAFDQAIEQANLNAAPGRSRLIAFLLINAILLLGIAGFVVVRRRRAAATRDTSSTTP